MREFDCDLHLLASAMRPRKHLCIFTLLCRSCCPDLDTAFQHELKLDIVQATSYLVTAWEALASQAGKSMADLPVTWSNVSIYQAVQAEAQDSVTLSVLLDRSDRFQVSFWLYHVHQ